jgi:hypothetical protein
MSISCLDISQHPVVILLAIWVAIWVTLHEHFLPSTNRNVIRLHGRFYQTSLQTFPLMLKYIDSINTQAKLINQLLDKIKARVNPSGTLKNLLTSWKWRNYMDWETITR